MGRYWLEVTARAWREACAEIWASPVRVALSIIPIFAAVAAWFVFRASGASPPYAAALSLAGLVALVLIVTIWKLATIPARIDAERLHEIEALKEQIKSPAKIVNPHDTDMEAAIGFAVHGEWGRAASEGGLFVPTLHAIDELEQFLANGLLRCWGRSNRNYGPHLPIDASHWRTHRLEPTDFLSGDYRSSPPSGGWSDTQRYALKFNAAEIEQAAWTRAKPPEADPRDDVTKYVTIADHGSQIAHHCAVCGSARTDRRATEANYACGARVSFLHDTWLVMLPCPNRA